MIRIVEEEDLFGKKYLKYVDEKLINTIQVVRCVKTVDNFEYMFLVDSSGKIIENVYKYLNDVLGKQNASSRNQALSALKVLYSYLEIANKKIEEIGQGELSQLTSFIEGGYFRGNNTELDLKTQRSGRTYNIYMGIYRHYMKTYSIENPLFFQKKVVSVDRDTYDISNDEKKIKTEKYIINKPSTPIYKNRVPKFISIEEYHKILTIIDRGRSKYKLRNKLIIMLMYERGLRIGEVLGLTLEDIIIHSNDKAGAIIIRNRVSDKRHQHAKGVMKVYSHADYSRDDYNKEGIGYQVVALPESLMNVVNEYIEDSRDQFNMTEKAWDNIYKFAKADSVTNNAIDNFYLFLSKNYIPLSETGWNRIIKDTFIRTGITLDRKKKRENLNHRFRHGFAMFLARELKVQPWELQMELRHRSSASQKAYYNPTDDMILEASTRIEERIKNKMESLRVSEEIASTVQSQKILED